MPDQVTLVTERPVTLGTLVGLFLWHRWDIGWIVIKVLMTSEKLTLPEALVTLITLKGLLVCVDEHMRFQMTLRDRRVRAEIAFETLLALVSLLVNLHRVSVRKCFSAHFALHWPLGGVQLLNVESEICFPATSGGTELTLEDRLITSVNHPVCFKGI